MKLRNSIVLGACLLLASASFADFRYQETTQITGGALVGIMKFAGTLSKDARQSLQPITSTVVVKGNRMARIDPDHTQIIDLDKETFTEIDHQKKEYTVLTFQEMKQRMEEAQRKAAEQQAKANREHPQESSTPPPQMNFKVNVRNTGASKQVLGVNTKEAILSLALETTDQQSGQKGALAFTNDMWMAPEIRGYDEVRDFQRRLALKMGMIFGGSLRASMAAMQPGSAQGMAEMVKEMSKLKGVPAMQVMRMGMTANGAPLPAASEAPLPPGSNGPDMPTAGGVAKGAATNAAETAVLGPLAVPLKGIGMLHRKKKEAEEAKQQPPQQQGQPGQPGQPGQNAQQSVLLESSSQITSFSSAPVDTSAFNVPAGYTEVQAGKEKDRIAVEQ